MSTVRVTCTSTYTIITSDIVKTWVAFHNDTVVVVAVVTVIACVTFIALIIIIVSIAEITVISIYCYYYSNSPY